MQRLFCLKRPFLGKNQDKEGFYGQGKFQTGDRREVARSTAF